MQKQKNRFDFTGGIATGTKDKVIAWQQQSDSDGLHKSGDNCNKKKMDSVLSKYVERFRHAAPLSREERRKQTIADERDFWWIDHNSRHGDAEGAAVDRPLTSDDSNQSKLLTAADVSWMDNDTCLLQQKTDLLLANTASSQSSLQPAVSTIGIGSDISGPTSIVSEEPYRPKFTINTDVRSRPVGPDEDILEQWRRRRRLEQAKERLVQFQSGPPMPVVPRAGSGLLMPSSSDSRQPPSASSNSALDAFYQKLAHFSATAKLPTLSNGIYDTLTTEKQSSSQSKKDAGTQISSEVGQHPPSDSSVECRQKLPVDVPSTVELPWVDQSQMAAPNMSSPPQLLPLLVDSDSEHLADKTEAAMLCDEETIAVRDQTEIRRHAQRDCDCQDFGRQRSAGVSAKRSDRSPVSRAAIQLSKTGGNRAASDVKHTLSDRVSHRRQTVQDGSRPMSEAYHTSDIRELPGNGLGDIERHHHQRVDGDHVDREMDPAGVQQMTGQGTKERPFDVSDSFTVVSSVASSIHDEDLPSDVESDTNADLTTVLMSDGEEFEDDPILKDLRRRRASYLKLLLQLDESIRRSKNGSETVVKT
jgi:hypothetical protein